MTYKQGAIHLCIVNEGLLDFNGKLKVCIPYHEEVSKAISVPRGEEITAITKYDEYLIPKRKYEVKAFVLKDHLVSEEIVTKYGTAILMSIMSTNSV